MERVEGEPFGFARPSFADELVGCEALQGFEATREVIGGDEVGEVLPELVVALVMVALDGCVLDGPVHFLDLAIGPRMPRLGQAMVHIVLGAGGLEGMGPDRLPTLQGFLDERRSRGRWRRKATTIASSSGESTVDLGSFGPVRWSATELRRRHFATVFGSTP
jgi:hypothetical protein